MKTNQWVKNDYQFNRQKGFLSIITGYTVAARLEYHRIDLTRTKNNFF
jgi:hypothetical protein